MTRRFPDPVELLRAFFDWEVGGFFFGMRVRDLGNRFSYNGGGLLLMEYSLLHRRNLVDQVD